VIVQRRNWFFDSAQAARTLFSAPCLPLAPVRVFGLNLGTEVYPIMKNILVALFVFIAMTSLAQASDGSDSAWEIGLIFFYVLIAIVLLVFGIWLFLTPVRLAKGKSNYDTVCIWTFVGLFTGIGWLIALYIALQPDPKAAIDVTESRAAALAAKIGFRGQVRASEPRAVPQPRVIPPPPGAQQTYRVASNGKDLGEFPVSAIKQLIEAGKLTMQDYYFDHDSNEWMPLDCLPDLV